MRSFIARSGWLLAALVGAAGATTIPGGNIPTQTWTSAGNPYIVLGDITVVSGATLTIQAGTVVQFAISDGQAQGIDTSRAELTVRGALSVNGTAASPVQFLAQSGTLANTWYGIVVDATATSAVINFADIRHAVQAVRSSAPGNVLQAASTAISFSGTGVNVLAGAPTLLGLDISNQNIAAIQVVSPASATIQNCIVRSNPGNAIVFSGAATATSAVTGTIIRNNLGHAVLLQPSGGSITVSVDQSTIQANSLSGVRVEAAAGATATATVKNSNVTQNDKGVERIVSGGPTSATVTYSNLWSNTTNYVNVVAGIGTLSANPLFVNVPNNYRLSSNSPSRFAGESGGDLGPLPYAGDPTPLLLGTLWSNLTLTAAGSPYTAWGDLTVAPGVTLTVEPGVTLMFGFSDGMASGADPTRNELIVRGTLNAVGTSANPISFNSIADLASYWRGILLTAASSGSSIVHAQISEAAFGVDLASGNANTLNHLTIDRCDIGIRASTGLIALDALTIFDCITGITVTGNASGTISNAVIRNNSGDGLDYITTLATSSLLLTHATIHQNAGRGVVTRPNIGNFAALTINNSNITQNTLVGVLRTTGGGMSSVTTTHSNVWGNTPNYQNTVPGSGALSANPQYVAPPTDLHLQSTSVSLDAGNAGNASDHDRDGRPRPLNGDGINGAEYDLGAYELLSAIPVTLSAVDASLSEGNSGNTTLSLPVTLNAATANTVTVDWAAIASGTATAGTDFLVATGALQFDPGQTTALVAVQVVGDITDEFDETFTITLSNPIGNATFADANAVATINDDDAPPTLTIADFGLCEGETGIVPLTLNIASGKLISIDASSANETAVSPADYASVGGSVTMVPGISNAGVIVQAANDSDAEPTESFLVNLSNPDNVTLGATSARVLIFDYDDLLCLIFRNGYE